MKTTKTTYRVKNLVDGWTSMPHSSIEEAKIDLVRMWDRAGMVEWKTRPPHNYVVVQEETVTTHTVIG